MKHLILILAIVDFNCTSAFAQTGTIKGTVKTSDGKPAEFVTVGLKGTTKGTSANNKGEYEIKNIAPGNYTLITSLIGLETKEQPVEVIAGETVVNEITLKENAQQLQEIVIQVFKLKRYTDTLSSAGTRLPLRLIETPQTIQVITNEVMKDQQVQNMNDVTKNMTGVVNNNMYTSYTMRGFTNYYPNSFIIMDGFNGPMYQWSQMVQLYNIDRVEMIAGPASALYSVGTPGGVINMVTKRPQEKSMYSFNATYGSWNLIDVSADLTGPLTKNKKLLYRLNVGYNYANSFRPYQFNQNIVIAPSLTYNFSDKTSLNLDYVNANNKTRFAYDRGGLVFMNKDSTYDWKGALNKFVHNSPADYGTINTHNVTLKFNHQFSNKFTLTYLSRAITTVFDMGEHYGITYGDNYFTQLDTIPRNYDTWLYKPYNFQNSLFTTATFGNETFKQTLVTGIDYQLYGNTKNRYVDGSATPISIANPDYSQDNFSSYQITSSFVQDDQQQITQVSAYVQDLISIRNKLKILLAGRYDNYHAITKPNSPDNYTQTNDTSTAQVFLLRIGVVYNLNNNNSIYGSYCESFNPQYSNNREAGGPFPPETGKQYEIGYKAQYLRGKLMPSIALYNIELVNVLKGDPTDSSGKRQIAVPGVTSRGAEFTLQGNIKNFSIVGGYAYNHVVLGENSPLGPKGARFDNAPNHIANLWLKYALPDASKLKGLNVSIGGKYVGDRVGSAFNQHFLMPAYFLLDGAVGYEIKKFMISLNGFNIFNTKYVLGAYYSDFQVPMGTPMNWKLSVRYTVK